MLTGLFLTGSLRSTLTTVPFGDTTEMLKSITGLWGAATDAEISGQVVPNVTAARSHVDQTTNQRTAERMELDMATVLNKALKRSSEKVGLRSRPLMFHAQTTRLFPAAFIRSRSRVHVELQK